MQKLKIRALFVVVCALSCILFFTKAHAYAADAPTLIAKSYAQNEISYTDYVFYQIQAVFSPDKLPAKFRSFEAAKPGREMTLLLLAAKQNFNRFTTEQQKYLNAVFARPTDNPDPGGDAYSVTEATPYCTAHYCIHYVATTADAPPLTDTSPANGIPDYVEFMGQEFEVVYNKENGAEPSGLGYNVPPSDGTAGGNSKFDVYLKNIGSRSLFGYDAPETQVSSNPVSYTSYMVMDNDYSAAEFPSYAGDYTKPLRVTAAHEYYHSIQFSYFGNAPTWLFESTATWVEDEVYDSINDNYNYMPTWFKYPQVSMDITSSTAFPSPDNNDKLHVYGTWIFMRYISEKYARNVVRKLWETGGTSCATSNADATDNRLCTLNAIDTVLQQNAVATLAAVLADFAARNYIKAGGDGIYREGSAYPNVTIARTHTSYPVSTQTDTLSHLSSDYNQFTAPDTNNNVLTISFNGPDNKNFAAKIVLVKTDGTQTENSVTLDSTTNDGTYATTGFGNTYNKVILIPVNTGKIAADGSTDNLTFTYSAAIAVFSSPSAPTGVSATKGDAQVALSWTAATAGNFSIASYNVWRSTTGSGSAYTKINSSAVTATTYTDSTASNGTKYFYVVTAVDSQGNESTKSSEVNATPAAATTTTTTFTTVSDGDVSTAVQTTLSTQAEGQSTTVVDPSSPGAKITVTGRVNLNNPGGGKLAAVTAAEVQVTINVYAINGSRVASPPVQVLNNGVYKANMDTDINGNRLANGIYACQTVIRVNGAVVSEKISKILIVH